MRFGAGAFFGFAAAAALGEALVFFAGEILVSARIGSPASAASPWTVVSSFASVLLLLLLGGWMVGDERVRSLSLERVSLWRSGQIAE